MTIQPSRTTNRLHFADLDPIRFEDLCLGLVYPFRPWTEIRHYGRLGSDGGVDILAVEPADNGVVRTWFIQCKRLGKASKVSLTRVVDDALSKSASPPYALLVVVACDVTKNVHESYHSYATEKGVVTPILWTASTLEARLYGDRKDLLFAYFGISLAERHESAEAAQFYAAEYSVLMGRISNWESLQYAAWPILLGALAILSHMSQIPVNYRWWAALISTLLVYVAYQGSMVNMLYSVLVIERDLRPLAGRLIGSENFWIHERARTNDFPSNSAWSTKWPVIISLLVIGIVAAGLMSKYGVHWYDVACLVVSLALLYMVAQLTKNGELLKEQIKKACTREVKLVRHTAVGEVNAPNRWPLN